MSWRIIKSITIDGLGTKVLAPYTNNYDDTYAPWTWNAAGVLNIGSQATLYSESWPDNNVNFYASSVCSFDIDRASVAALSLNQWYMGIRIIDKDTKVPTGYGLGWFGNGLGTLYLDIYKEDTKAPLGAGVYNGAWGDLGALDVDKYHVGIYRGRYDDSLVWCKMNNLGDWNYSWPVRADIQSFAFLEKQFCQYWATQYNIPISNGIFQSQEEAISPEYGEASTPEGYTGGTFDDSSDTISIPTAPTIGVSSSGFVNVYNPSSGALIGFGSELFPNLSFTPISSLPAPTDVQTALENIATIFTDFGNQIPNIIDMYINSNLIQYVLDCHIIPVAPSVGSNAAIKVGFRTFTQTAAVVTNDYIDFDCGSLNVGEYYANYIDYAPFTSAKLFLPFVGFVDMLPEYWQSGTLSVTYRFNVIDGSFVAFVKSTSSKSKLSDTVIGQYGGNCCVHIPLTGANYSNMVSGLVSGAAAVLTAGSGAAAKVSKAVSSAVNVSQIRPNVQQSNGYNSTTSFLGVRTPYLLIERSVSSFSMDYATENGLPSNVTATLSSLSGYTEASDLILNGIDATDAELNEIAALLASGVIL